MIKVAASIMCGKPLEFGKELDALKEANVDLIHFDVMDGEYVPNIAMGLYMLEAMKEYSKIPFDVHLMVVEPDVYFERIAKAGVEILCVHAEAVTQLHRSIAKIKSLGMKAGVVLNPATPLNVLENILSELDMVVLMTVNPGFSGGKFIDNQYAKIKKLRQMINEVNPNIMLEVDGNIGPATIPGCVENGADVLVCGTSCLFKGNSLEYKQNVEDIRKLANASLKGGN